MWAGNEAMLLDLIGDDTPEGRSRLHYFLINKGPWSRLDHNQPFVSGAPSKPEGGSFYPADASKEDIAKFVKEMGVNYPILIGKEDVGNQYGGVNVLPTTFFIDRDGKIVAREFGLQSRSLFVDNIKKSLSQGTPVQAQK